MAPGSADIPNWMLASPGTVGGEWNFHWSDKISCTIIMPNSARRTVVAKSDEAPTEKSPGDSEPSSLGIHDIQIHEMHVVRIFSAEQFVKMDRGGIGLVDRPRESADAFRECDTS